MARGLGGVLLGVACAVLVACAPGDGAGPWPEGCPGTRASALPSPASAFWARGASLPDEGDHPEQADTGVDPATHQVEDGLPVFHLFLAESLPDEEGERPARLYYRGHCYALELKPRGETSSTFPKRSYTLDFADEPFDEPVFGGGVIGRRKLVLISPFNDNSYLRARLAFTLWSRMSPDHLPVKSYSAVVYVNGRYDGLYTAADHIDQDLLAGYGLDPEGDLFKAVNWDANFSRRDANGAPKRSPGQGFEKKAGLPESGDAAFASIAALNAFVDEASDEDFRARRDVWMDSRDYEDWWVFATLTVARDSIAKNAYHHRERGPAARWRFLPWDLDATFGQEWNTERNDPTALDDFTARNHLFARMLADPLLAESLHGRLQTLLHGELRVEEVLALIDTFANEVEAAALKDEARWGESYVRFPRWSWREDFTTHAEEVDYLREWVRARWSELARPAP